MATVIDALVVTLGLNAQNFVQGNREANQSLNQTRQNTRTVTQEEDKREKQQDRNRKNRNKDHTENKKQQRENIDNFRELTKQAITFFGITTSLGGMASWIGGITQANSQLYRASNNLGTNVEHLKEWGMAIEQTGGDAKSAVSTMQMLSDTLTGLQLGIMPQNANIFSMLGVDLNKAYNSAEPLVEVLKMINKGAQNIKEQKGIREAFNIVRMLGVDYDMANLLVKDEVALNAFLASADKINKLNKEQAENSAKLAQQWVVLKQKGEALGQSIEQKVTPYVQSLLENLMLFVEQNPKAILAVSALAAAFMVGFGPVKTLLAGISALLVIGDFDKLITDLGKLLDSAKNAWYALNGAFDEKSKNKVDQKIIGVFSGALQYLKNIDDPNSKDWLSQLVQSRKGLGFNVEDNKSKVTRGADSSSGRRSDGKSNRLIPFMKPDELKKDLLSKGWPEKEAQAEIDKIVKDVGLSEYGYINAKIPLGKFSESSDLSKKQVMQLQTNAAKLAANPSNYTNSQSNSTTTNSTNVGQVIINTQASDARGIYNEFVNRVLANQAESGGF